jgi:hypothetical protein
MIKILSYNRVQEKKETSKVIAYVDIEVKIGGLTGTTMLFNNIPHLEHEGKKWLSLPTFSRTNPLGEREFRKHWCFQSEDYNKKFLQKLNEKLKEFIGEEEKAYELCF